MAEKTVVQPRSERHPAFSCNSAVLQAAKERCAQRSDELEDVIDQIMVAFTAGRWSPRLAVLPAAASVKLRMTRLRVTDPAWSAYTRACEEKGVRKNTPIVQGLWEYANTPADRAHWM